MEVAEMETRMTLTEEMVENKINTEPDEDGDYDENMSDSPCGSVPSTSVTPGNETHMEDGSDPLSVIKRAVVVLTRLPDYKISALRPPTPPQFYSEDDSLSSSDSDMQGELEEDDSDSDFSLANKQKTCRHTTINNNNNNNEPPMIVSSVFAHCSSETTKVRPNLPEEEIRMDMVVLGRKRSLTWQRGKIVDIVTKEDGRIKYKVSFEKRQGRILVSGHHIAFDTTPKLEQLYVGARVVVRCPDNKFRFRPGVLAELPSRKNRLRFLVFQDDHMPIYVGLPSLHLVCRPQEDVLDDIPGGFHKSFMMQYLRDWPHPHLTQYKPGQNLNAELNGAQQRCEVQVVDCSLMQVVFKENQQKEWIYRGSTRLEHMARFLEMKAEEQDSDSD